MKKFNMYGNTELGWIEELIGLGFNERSGCGHFSRVYATKRDTVLKLTVDAQYMKYIDVIQGANNKYFPEILNNFGCIGTIGRDNVEVFAIEMPYYTGVGEDFFIHSGVDYDHVEYTANNLKWLLNNGTEALRVALCSLGGKDPITEFCQILNLDYFEFLDAINFLLHNFGNKKESFFDTHLGNFMVDDSGILKMTDPVADHANAVHGLSVPRNNGSLGMLLHKLDKSKLDKIKDLLCVDISVPLFAKFKMNVQEDKPSAINFTHLHLNRQSYDKDVAVMLGASRLGKFNTYGEEKKRRSSREVSFNFAGFREVDVVCNIGGKEFQLEGFKA